MNRFERWSRRKLDNEIPDPSDNAKVGVKLEEESGIAAADENVAESSYENQSLPAASESNALGEELASDDPVPGSLDDTLPDPDTLPPGSDIKAFLEPGVSQGLRRRALRRLFAGDKYGIRDGLDDYDLDYREILKPLAGELAQRMRQWTRPVDPPEEEDVVDEALTDTPQDSTAASLEDATTDQEADQRLEHDHDKTGEPTSDSADAADSSNVADAQDPSSEATLDEGRIGTGHQINQN